LYIRPVDSADSEAVSAFSPRHDSDARPGMGLLGALGDIVAVVALEITDDAIRIDEIVRASCGESGSGARCCAKSSSSRRSSIGAA
jgi:hypothetical protein